VEFRACRLADSVAMTIMKKFVVLFFSIFAAASLVSGSLGDGYDQIDDAYGTIMERHLHDDGTVSVLYKKDRYLYQVTFANGRSVSESYFHVKGTDLSEKEIARFLKANRAGATWKLDSTARGRRVIRGDGNAEATYAPVNGRPALTVRELRGKP